MYIFNFIWNFARGSSSVLYIAELCFLSRRISDFTHQEERADYIIDSYYMKISLARSLHIQKFRRRITNHIKPLIMSVKAFISGAELYRHHTAFTIKIVFDWIYISTFLLFRLR